MDKAMDRRGTYCLRSTRRRFADVDREYHRTAPGQVGPLQARLEKLAGGGRLKDLLDLCVGAFGDITTDLDRLLRAPAETRALYL